MGMYGEIMIDYLNIEKYEKTDSLCEVEKFLKYLVNNRMVFNGWQRVGEEHIQFKLFMEEINPYEPEIRIEVTNESPVKELSKLNQDLPLYLYTESKKYVAEVEIVYVAKHHFFIMPPHKMLVKKNRKVPRIRIDEKTFQKKELTIMKDNKSFQGSLIDISETGIGLFISKEKAKYFRYEGDTVHISQMLGKKLENSIIGHIVYCQESNDPSMLRVGIQFYEDIVIEYFVPEAAQQSAKITSTK